MAYPLQRHQQYTITREDGLAYTWDPATGRYVNTKGLTYEQQHPTNANYGDRPSVVIGADPLSGLTPGTPEYDAAKAKLATPGTVPGPAPAPAAPAPDPYQNWLSKDPGSRSYRYIGDDATKKFYEDNPAQAWQQYTNAEFGTRDTPQSQYAQSQYGRYYADYLRWSEGDTTGQRTWTDYQSNDLAGQIRSSFQVQSPSQKGYNLLWQPAGRVA